MSRNFLRTLLALTALVTASVAPTSLHAAQAHAKVVPSLHENAGPGGGTGGDGDPNPCDGGCAVRAL